MEQRKPSLTFVGVKIDPGHLRQIDAAARERGLNRSAFIRSAAITTARQSVVGTVGSVVAA